MIEVKFSNAADKKDVPRVFRTLAIQLAGNAILGFFNNSMVPIATGTGDLWRVGNQLYTNVEIKTLSTRSKVA